MLQDGHTEELKVDLERAHAAIVILVVKMVQPTKDALPEALAKVLAHLHGPVHRPHTNRLRQRHLRAGGTTGVSLPVA